MGEKNENLAVPTRGNLENSSADANTTVSVAKTSLAETARHSVALVDFIELLNDVDDRERVSLSDDKFSIDLKKFASAFYDLKMNNFL
jgi:hypothetical protein